MSREDRDIVLDGQMPVSLVGITSEGRAMDFLNPLTWVEAVEYRNRNEFIRDVIDACSTEFAKFDYLPEEGDSFFNVWAALAAFRQSERDRVYVTETAAQDERAELGRQERERYSRHHDVDQLASGLRGCDLSWPVIIHVLHGDPNAIDLAGSRIREVARSRESSGLAPANSHSRLLSLLRRSGIPGSEEAQQYLRERTRLTPPGITRLGQAIDLPASDDQRRSQQGPSSDQLVVKSAFKDALFAFLRAYDGAVPYVVTAFAVYVLDYRSAVTARDQDDLGQALARNMIETAADISPVPIDTLIPARLRSSELSPEEQGNEHAGQTETTPTNQLSEPPGPGDVLGRDSGEPDDPAGAAPTNPSIIRL